MKSPASSSRGSESSAAGSDGAAVVSVRGPREPGGDMPEYQMGRVETEKLRQLEHTYLSRPRVSIRLRIVAGFLLCFFLLAGTGLINLVILYQARSKLHFLDISQSLSLQIQDASHTARLDFPDEQNLVVATRGANSALDLLLNEGAPVLGATGERDLTLLNYRMGHYVQLLDDAVTLSKSGGALDRGTGPLAEQLDSTASGILDLLRTMKARQAVAADRVLSLSQKLPFVFSAVMLLIIFWITGMLAGTITASLQRLEESTRRIAAGDFTLMNPRRRYHDEFSDLALAVNRMLLELRAREAQVNKADRLASVGLVASGFAQRLSGAFDAISDAVETFIARCPQAEECGQCGLAQAVSAETGRGKDVVAQLLDFAFDDQFVLEDVSLCEIVESARRLLQDQLDAAHITFVDDIPPGMPRVRGAASQLRHVFVNLFHNAIQAMPGGGSLSVRAALLDGGWASVAVSDDGVGIPPENLAHIFDPSFTTKDHRSGTGLGLSISHGVIKRHGGDLRVESLVGAGTTVHVTLPLAPRSS
ncbi:MAG: ATP-binding protein [Gemmatimonadota bacterium]